MGHSAWYLSRELGIYTLLYRTKGTVLVIQGIIIIVVVLLSNGFVVAKGLIRSEQ